MCEIFTVLFCKLEEYLCHVSEPLLRQLDIMTSKNKYITPLFDTLQSSKQNRVKKLFVGIWTQLLLEILKITEPLVRSFVLLKVRLGIVVLKRIFWPMLKEHG